MGASVALGEGMSHVKIGELEVYLQGFASIQGNSLNPDKVVATFCNAGKELYFRTEFSKVMFKCKEDVDAWIKICLNKIDISDSLSDSVRPYITNKLWVADYAGEIKSILSGIGDYVGGNVSPNMSQMFEKLPEAFSTKVKCPECNKSSMERLWHTIQHLNDHHKKSREEIADWLESLDIDLEIKNEPTV